MTARIEHRDAPPTAGEHAPRVPHTIDATTGDATTGDATTGRASGRGRASHWKVDTQRWARWLHVYTSMLALLLVLFFGITGITLNHPSWTFGDDLDSTTTVGELPIDVTSADGSIDFLSVSEYLRDEYDVVGSVDSFGVVNGEGSIAYKNPGYAADAFFDVETGEFTLTVEQQGWVGVINDLHKGRNAGDAWRWVIDVAAGFLVVISLTGLVMQLVLRKRRTSALVAAGVGSVAAVAVMFVALA